MHSPLVIVLMLLATNRRKKFKSTLNPHESHLAITTQAGNARATQKRPFLHSPSLHFIQSEQTLSAEVITPQEYFL